MVQIAALEAGKRAFTISPEAEKKVLKLCTQVAGQPEEGNGRFCRNLVEKAILEYATRVYDLDGKSMDSDFCLLPEDFCNPEEDEDSSPRRIGFAA